MSSYLLSLDDFLKICEFIYRKIGIHLEKDNHYEKITTYINKRIIELELDNFAKYFFNLRFEDKDSEEFQKLVNVVSVNDTYFFREKDHFEVLINNILPELDKKIPKTRPLRILSAPCSSGEEPYSILIHLLEDAKLIERRDVEIVGIDIDSNIIEKAKKSEYSGYAIHAISKNILDKYFIKNDTKYKIMEELVDKVDFKIVNIFDESMMNKLGTFDIIFSRNMFIYFDDISRKKVANTFYGMLNTNGFVILGHAENMSRVVSIFKTRKIDSTLVYQK